MKKILIIAVLLIVSIFYISTTSFSVVDYFKNEGYIFTNNEIQTNLYSGNLKKVVTPSFVEEDQEILERWGTLYADVDGRKKINTVYPMHITDGAGIQFLDYDNIIYDASLRVYDGYKGLNINNGEGYNNSFERADTNEYTLAKLNNNLYVNVQEMDVKTIANNYKVKLNSYLYLTPDHINYAYYDYGTFRFDIIDDVNEDSLIRIGSMEIRYGDLLLSLGEMAIVEETPKQEEEPQDQQYIIEDISYQGKAKVQHLKNREAGSSIKKTGGQPGKKASKKTEQQIVLAPVRANIIVEKIIDVLYDEPETAKVFAFNVYDEDGELINSLNTIGEDSASFALEFDKEGFYTYYISEVDYGYEDYAFDDSIKTLEIEVTRIDNKLAINRIAVDSYESNVATFVNSYSHIKIDGEVEGSVYIRKSFDSSSAERPDNKNFSFTIVKASNFAPNPDNANPTVYDEGLTGTSFKFTKEGTYEYVVKENDLGYTNYDFDSSSHIVRFVLKKEGDILKIVDQTVDGVKTNTVTFTNKYNGISQINVDLIIKNNITDVGNMRTRNKIFTYNVDLGEGTYIEPASSELQISDVGTSRISLTFDRPGVYEYKVTQLDSILDPTYDPYMELPRELVKINNSKIYHYYVDDNPRDGAYDYYDYGEDKARLYYGLDDSEYAIKITVTELNERLYVEKEITRTQNGVTRSAKDIVFSNIFCSAHGTGSEGEESAGSSTSSCLVCTFDIEGGGHGSGGHSTGEHEYEKIPADPEAPDTPTGDVNPEQQHEHEDDPIPPIIPEWAMPTITLVEEYDPTTYTVTTKVKIVDPAGVIQDNKVTYEIILNEGENAGKTYKRVSFDAGYGEHEYTINGLRADTEYIIKGYFRYRDEMNKLVTTPVYFDEGTPIKTKDIGDLGSIYINPIDMTDSQILSNQVNIPYLSFDISEGKSSKDALSSVSTVTVELTDEEGNTHLFRLPDDSVSRLINGLSVSYTTKNSLTSGMNYTGKIVCYDMYGNLIDVVNDTFTAHTCKKLPKANVKITYPSLDTATINTTITIPDTGEYVTEYNNLRAVITDSKGNVIPFDGAGYKEIVSGEPFTVDGLGLNKTYTVTILMDCDNGDGTGVNTKQLYSKPFVTGRLSDLGSLYLNVSNVTKEKFSSDDVQDKKNLATRAVLNVQLNDRSTKEDLLNFVDELYITLTHDTDRYQYKLTDEELAILLSDDPENNIVEIDTSKFIPEGLLSNTEYALSYQAKYTPEGDEALDIAVRSSLNKLKTNRMPLITKIDSLDAYTGFIISKFKVEDIDDIIEGETYILRVVKIEDDGKMTIVGSYNINKNEDFELNMSADSEISTDGLSHIIEGNSDYAFRFIAKEANLDTGVETSYLFHEERFSTRQSLEGDIYLIELEDLGKYRGDELPEGFEQLEYIEATGIQYLDLGNVVTKNTSATIEYQPTVITGSQAIFGGAWSGHRFLLDIQSSRWYWHGSTVASSSAPETAGPSVITVSKNKFIVNGKEYAGTDSYTGNLKLLGLGAASYNAKGKLYSFKMYESDTIAHDYIPVRRTEDGKVGLYDVVAGTFLENKGTGEFGAGSVINPSTFTADYDSDKYYVSRLGINLYEDTTEGDWYTDNVAYVNVYRHSFVDGKETVELDNEEPIEIHYEGDGGYFDLEYPVLIDQNTNDYYSFELFYNFELKNEDTIHIFLDSAEFSTEEPIYTISNIDEFFAVGPSNHKYVVIDDLYFDAMYKGRDDTAVYKDEEGKDNYLHWKASPMNAQIDFQGHSMNLDGTGTLIYEMSKTAKIENMVLNIDRDFIESTSVVVGGGTFVNNNRGTISNILVRYGEEQIPEEYYKYGSYYTKTDEVDAVHYMYQRSGGLCTNNYGTIENFAIDVQTDTTSTGWSGFAVIDNCSGGVLRNGYVYSSRTDENGEPFNDNKATVNILGSAAASNFGIVVGRNQTNAVVENVFALGDINLESVTCNATGIIAGNNVGIVRNCYAVGDTMYNFATYPSINMKATTYGPAIGTSGNYVNQNIYYISDNIYSSASSTPYNSVASIMSLRNKSWQNTILNTKSTDVFTVDSLIESNCYPQVIYTSDAMPQQDYIELMSAPSYSAVDLIYSYAYELGSDKNIDDMFEDYESINGLISDIGTTVWDYEINEDGVFSNTQRFIALVSNKSELPIDSMSVSGLETKVIANINDGTGITTVLGYCYNPIKAYSSYNVLKLVIKDYDVDSYTEVPLDTGRKLFVEYYRAIEDEEGWIEHLHKTADKEVDQNFILENNIDFNEEYYLNDVYVNDIYTGKFDGNGKTVGNTKFTVFDYAKEGIVKASPIGLFKQINGYVHDLKIDDIHFEGGKYAGVLTGEIGGGSVDNVFISDSSVVGGNYTGGLAGYTLAGTTISNSGIKNIKLSSNGTTDSSDLTVSTGGLVGYEGGLTLIDSSYAQNIYIENWIVAHSCGVGGIVGWNGSSNYGGVTNSYATGVIVGAADGMGGIYGIAQGIANVDNCYSDVDIICYNGNAGGIIGRAINSAQNVSDCITFGNVISGNILDDPDDMRIPSVDLINVDTNRFSTGFSYEDAVLDLRYRDLSGNILSMSDSLMHQGTFSNDYSAYLNNTIFECRDNYLPLLLDSEGNRLYGQEDEYISEDNPDITLQEISVDGNKIKVVVSRDRSIKIEGFETDYCFYEAVTQTDGNGINALSHHEALDFSRQDVSINDMLVRPIDTFTYTIGDYASAYDLYRITAIKYSDENGTHYLRVNRTLDLPQQYKEIDSFTKWNNLFHNNQSFAENIRITGDIDFSSNQDKYNSEGNVNVTINRLEGKVENSEANYLDVKNNKKPYYCLSNATIDTTKDSSKNPWLFNGWVGLVRTTITNCENVSFENNSTTYEANAAIVALPVGTADNLTFDNCSIATTGPSGSSGFSGMFGFTNCNIENIYIRNAKVNSKTTNTGIMAGYITNGKLRNIIKNIVIEDSELISSSTYSGAIAGQLTNPGRNFLINKDYSALTSGISASLSDSTITNVSIQSTNTYAGGLAGLINYGTYVEHCNVIDSNIKGTQYVGGITGYGGSNNIYINEDYVYNSKVWGTTSYVGGISGIYGRVWNCVVEDCEVASPSYVGGLWGRGQTWIDRTNQDTADNTSVCGWVKNTKIYGSNRVGGIMGYTEASVDALGFVENCEIYGNTYVGGAVGYINRYWIGTPYVSDTIISPIKANKYNIAASSSPSYFGGLIGYGGRAAGFVENCVIGSQNVSYVGGLQGEMDYYESATAVQTVGMCKDSVVYGYDYVGGMFGKVITISNSYDIVSFDNYSNAYVVGHDYVAGIAGTVSGMATKVSNVDTYVRNPYLEYSYFTGSLKASERASAFYGKVIGNTTSLSMAGLVSIPYSISGKNVEVVLIDGDLSENNFYYNYSNLENESANLKLSVADKTKIYIDGNDSITNMEQLLAESKYINHVTSDYSLIEADFTGGRKTDRKFIYLYTEGGNTLDPEGSGINFVRYRGDELPDGYEQIEFIEATGTQYFDLGNVVTKNTSATIEYQPTVITGSQAIFGGAWSGHRFLLDIQSSRWYWHGSSVASSSAPETATRSIITVSKTKFIVNGKEYAGTDSYTGNLKLLGLGAASYNAKGRLYSFKIYENEMIAHDYIPVRKLDTGKVGIYDVVAGTFLENKGTGNFVAGSVAAKPDYDGDANYIANGIYSKSLSGPSKLGTKTWYYDLSLITNDYMPLVGINNYNPNRYWDGVSGDGMNYETVIANPVTNAKNTISVKQGVYLPFTGKFDAAYSGMYNLFTNYEKYLHGQMNYDEFIGSSSVGNVDSNVELIDVYAQDVNTLNIDISSDLVQLYSVENRSGELPNGFEQLQYIEATGTQYIDLGNVITANTSATIEYQPTSISGSQAIFGGSWAGYRYLLDIQSSRWYWHGNSKNSGITPATDKPSIITVSRNKFIVNGTEFSTSESYTGNLKLLGLGAASYNARGRLYSFKLYESGVLAHDYVPSRRLSDGAVGIYDLKTNTFYMNNGTGDFVAGNGLPTIKVEIAGIASPIIDSSLDKRTYSFDYDFVNDVKVTLSYTNASNNYVTRSMTFLAKDLRNRIGGSNNELYYIGEGDKLYSSDDNAVYINEEFANIFRTQSLTKSGTIYDLPSKSSVGTSTPNTIHANSEPIYKFTLSSGAEYNTFGTYSINNVTAASTLNRFYVYDGNLVMLRDGQDGTYNPYFKNNKFEAYLRDDGKLISLGTNDLVDFLNKGENKSGASIGFSNEDIVKITASLDVNNTVIGFTYKDGRSVGYDISGSKAIMLFETVSDPVLMSAKRAPSLMSFLTKSLSNMFSLPSSSSIPDERSESEDLITMMSMPNMSLNKVVSTLNDSGELSAMLDEDDLSFVLSNSLVEDSGEIADGLDSSINMMTLANFNMSKDGVESYNMQPAIEGLTDNEDLTSPTTHIKKDKSDDYVLVYNEKTEEFDIFTTEELIENPEDPVSENYKVIDKSTLKSLYQAFDDENRDDAHGITLYVVIAGAILVLTAGIALSSKK